MLKRKRDTEGKAGSDKKKNKDSPKRVSFGDVKNEEGERKNGEEKEGGEEEESTQELSLEKPGKRKNYKVKNKKTFLCERNAQVLKLFFVKDITNYTYSEEERGSGVGEL